MTRKSKREVERAVETFREDVGVDESGLRILQEDAETGETTDLDGDPVDVEDVDAETLIVLRDTVVETDWEADAEA